jgi:hypothetical protein
VGAQEKRLGGWKAGEKQGLSVLHGDGLSSPVSSRFS